MTEYEWKQWRDEVNKSLRNFELFMAKIDVREEVAQQYRELTIKKFDSARNWIIVAITLFAAVVSFLAYLELNRSK